MYKKKSAFILVLFYCVFNTARSQPSLIDTSMVVSGNKNIKILYLKPDSFPLVALRFCAFYNNGRQINNITKDKIIVRESESECEIVSFEKISKGKGANVALVIDHSISMLSQFGFVKELSKKLVLDLNDELDKIALIGFASEVEENTALNGKRKEIIEKINKMKTAGNTALYDGINSGLKRMKKAIGFRAIVVVTDGGDNSSFMWKNFLIRKLVRKKIPVYIVNVGNTDDLKSREIAERSHGNYFYLQSMTGIESILKEIQVKTKQQVMYKIKYKRLNNVEEVIKGKIEISSDGSEMNLRVLDF
ncbi:MAG: VWA domain-containing protein [Bacteroidia bacterium]|nr:VWA domain-containing protein [Bacteroidia bacterium]